MPSAVATDSHAVSAAPDDLDNLFNYDNDVHEFLRDLPINNETQDNSGAATEPAKDIDEEIKIKKRRKPVPKLDESLLLSDAGVPRLRRITKTRLKFRGKGHEFSDISRLLNTYQLWLDDLYPRAKFKDAVQMVEKVGHSKRMQITRKAWLDDTKAYQRERSLERIEDVEMSGALPSGGGQTTDNVEDSDDAIFAEELTTSNATHANPSNSALNDAPEDDDLEALLAEEGNIARQATIDVSSTPRGPFEEDEDPDEDEMDALLAEQPAETEWKTASRNRPVHVAKAFQSEDTNQFADEEEVLAGMDDMW